MATFASLGKKRSMKPRRELQPSDVTILIDNREQLPFTLSPMKTERGTLTTGDYGIKGLEHVATVERKSVPDLIGVIGNGRDRFERELKRMLAYETRAIVVEGSWSTIELKQYRGDIHPNAVIGTIIGWIAMGIPVNFCGDRERADQFTARLLFIAARRRFRELQSFLPSLKVVGDEPKAEQDAS